jgi:hypothetical protein
LWRVGAIPEAPGLSYRATPIAFSRFRATLLRRGIALLFGLRIGIPTDKSEQSKRPKRLREVSSLAHREIALLLQAAYCDYQIGTFENFHQLVEDTFIVLRPGPKIFFQYELRFFNCLKSQLLIGHRFLPIKIVDQSPLVAHQKYCSDK